MRCATSRVFARTEAAGISGWANQMVAAEVAEFGERPETPRAPGTGAGYVDVS